MRKLAGLVCFCAVVCCCGALRAGEEAERNVHVVVKGDCLWDIAGKYCGQPRKWRKLYKGNMRIIKNPELIYPGQTLAVTCLPDGGIKMEPVAPAEAAAIDTAPVSVAVSSPAEQAAGAEPAPEAAPKKPAGPDADDRLLSELKELADGRGRAQEDNLSVSPEMPADMTWGFPSQDNQLVAPDWREDGKVVAADLDDPLDTLAAFGDVVQLELRTAGSVRAGELVFVFRRGNVIKDSNGAARLQLQRSAALKIRAVNGTTATAEVVRAVNPVEVDDLIMK
ncbi:MAG: LysM peptidoglycan-binding domain-containing protein [Elusimicrobiaceae bacterium]|nr:LysM peptidoglycan-binding domain-containing protein [Elusimicrobiaceae bacterium]